MDERPTWLPEPPPQKARPLGERVRVAALSFVSLLLVVFGSLMLLLALLSALKIVLGTAVILVVEGIITIAAAALLRQSLHEFKSRPLD